MQVFIFAYREKTTGDLVEVRTRADNEKKALKAFKLKVPAIDFSQIETINGFPFGGTAGSGSVTPTEASPQKARTVAEHAPTAHSSQDSKPENYLLGSAGVICMAIGLYLLLVNPGADTEMGVIVNLQKLSIGQTFSIVGAIFIAVQWRPR
jgi:hypothetical protein